MLIRKLFYPKVYYVGSIPLGMDVKILQEIRDGKRLIITQQVRDIIDFTVGRMQLLESKASYYRERDDD